MVNKIDFVIPWVDGSDPLWLAEKQRHLHSDDNLVTNCEARYRDWNTLKYWFRAVEKFAPWVNRVFFVTCGQVPDFLNLEHPKLRFVQHKEYIPSQWLPTFSANPIELNLHRIPDLSEQFVYFNDDMFVVAPTEPEDFFQNGLPCDQGVLGLLTPWKGDTPAALHWVLNDIFYINHHFNKNESIEKHHDKWFNPIYGSLQERTDRLMYWNCFTGFYTPHIQQSFLKSTFNKVWAAEPEVLKETSSHRFRNSLDVNQYLMRFWQLASGDFAPYPKSGQYYGLYNCDFSTLSKDIHEKGYKTICLNDSEMVSNECFVSQRQHCLSWFETLLSEKSSFER